MLLKIAIPVVEGRLSAHFGEARQFALAEADLSGRKIPRTRVVAAPPHEPGSFPRWLREQGVQVIVVGSIGQRALDNLLHHDIEVRTGRPGMAVEILLADCLKGKLSLTQNGCNNQHDQTADVHECRLAEYLGAAKTQAADARPSNEIQPH